MTLVLRGESASSDRDGSVPRVRLRGYVEAVSSPQEHPLGWLEKAPEYSRQPTCAKRLKQAGTAAGVDFTGKCDVVPNTNLAHALVMLSESKATNAAHDKLATQLLKAYFTDGDDIASVDNLKKWGAEAGLGKEGMEAVLKDRKACEKAVLKEIGSPQYQAIRGVPYFFINGKPMFSGAQPPKTFVRAFREAAKAAKK